MEFRSTFVPCEDMIDMVSGMVLDRLKSGRTCKLEDEKDSFSLLLFVASSEPQC